MTPEETATRLELKKPYCHPSTTTGHYGLINKDNYDDDDDDDDGRGDNYGVDDDCDRAIN